MTDISEKIDKLVKENDVVLFMKGNIEMPRCGFSGMVCKILNNIGVAFKDIDVLESEELRQGIKDYTDWPTIPQLYIKGEFMGGCDIVRELYESGELKSILQEKSCIQ